MATSCRRGEESRVPDPRFPDSLVGTWVRVYPYAGGRDTLVLKAGGRALRPATAINGMPSKSVSHWQVGKVDSLAADSISSSDRARFPRADPAMKPFGRSP